MLPSTPMAVKGRLGTTRSTDSSRAVGSSGAWPKAPVAIITAIKREFRMLRHSWAVTPM